MRKSILMGNREDVSRMRTRNKTSVRNSNSVGASVTNSTVVIKATRYIETFNHSWVNNA